MPVKSTISRKNSLIARGLLFIALAFSASAANAGLFCSEAPFFGVVDGNERATYGGSYTGTVADPFPTQITIDQNCTFVNFPANDPLTATLNFQTNDPSVYLIVFDNVIFTGNMACANIDHRLWFVNGADYGSNNNCQDLFIPVEKIDKQNPAGVTSVGIGDPFTYTLTIPVLYDPVLGVVFNSAGSDNDLHSIVITDDLNATGADLTLVGTPSVVWNDGSNTPVAHSFSNVGGLLTFTIDPGEIIPAGDQILINITVVADNTNSIGDQIVNTAEWSFGRLIEIDGVPTFFDPLPGENGVTDPLAISAPLLQVTKSSPDTAINAGVTTTFTIDVQNIGGADAWDVTILDLLPDDGPAPQAGMCDTNPNDTLTAQVFAADGVTPVSAVLVEGVDFTTNYAGDPTCEFTFITQSAAAVIGPNERLIITYQSQLDAGALPPAGDGIDLTNVAGAIQWFSADSGFDRSEFNEVLTDGSNYYEDSHTITTALTGYIFQKTVENLTTGENPATFAASGDTLRYRLRLYNFDETINDVTFSDTLDGGVFDLASFNMVTLPGNATFNYDSGTGVLQIVGNPPPLNLTPPLEFIAEFEITLDSGLSNGDLVRNQASFIPGAGSSVPGGDSDDPNINGAYIPGTTPGVPDPTDIYIQAPGALAKDNPVTTEYVIGDQLTYRITIPAAPVGRPLYDVRILDLLEDMAPGTVDLSFVSAVQATPVLIGGVPVTYTLTNTGTATSPVIENTNTGIDLPANTQLEVDLTVEVLNVLDNQAGDQFSNTASYTYNRLNGNVATQTDGGPATTASMVVLEPQISSLTKTASNITPTAGEVITYSIAMQAASGGNFSDVFDVSIFDSLALGLVYEGTPTVTVTANGSASDDNVIGEPDITGDGVTTPQTLFWGPGATDASDIDIPEGATVTVTYQVRVLDTVLAGSTLTNTVVASWTSLDGAPNFERDGSDGIGGLNDYITAPVIEEIDIPNIIAAITKDATSDTFNPADDNVRIGDTVDYTLTVDMPEGTLVNMQLVDTLPQGLQFVDIVSINGVANPGPYTAVAPFSHADITLANVTATGNPETDPTTTVTWNLGNVTNLPVDDTNNDFVIVYRARVLNDVFALGGAAIPASNSVDLNYDTVSGTTTVSDTAQVTVQQPALTVTKSSVPPDGSVVNAGDVITYTVDIENTGTAPAYDVLFQDTLPAGMQIAGVNVTSVSLLSGTPVTSPFGPTSYAAGVATWDFNVAGTPDAYTIPAADTLRIVYTAEVDATVAAGSTLTNAAVVNTYYSFDDEAIPANSVLADHQVYGQTNTSSVTFTTPPGPPLKENPVNPTATIGQEFTYTITIPEVAQPLPLYDLRILDNLGAIANDVTLVSIDKLSLGGTWLPGNTSGDPTNLVITDTTGTGGIDVPANSQIQIAVTVRLDNTTNNTAPDTFANTVSYTYNQVDNNNGTQVNGGSSVTADMTVVEPDLTVSKAVTNATAGKAPADPITGGDVLQYVVTIDNVGTSTAFDINVVDTLPPELAYYAAFAPTATIDTAPVGSFVSTPSGTPAGPLVWGSGNADGSLDLPAGSQLVITYQAQVQVSATASFQNEVWVDWTSLDGVNGNERTGAGCPTVSAPNTYCFGPVNVISNIIDNNNIAKAITDDTWDTDGSTAVDATARVGDAATYQLTLNLGEGTTSSVVVTDTLPAGLVYDSLVGITPASGAGDFTYSVSAQPSPGDTGVLTWNLGDVINAPSNDSTPLDALVIEYQARVIENDASTVAQLATQGLQNSATLAYTNSASNSNPAQLSTTADLTVNQPVMTAITKTGNGATNTNVSALSVNVALDTVDFQLESCNTAPPAAPAYSVMITDDLPTEMDETSIAGLAVTINGIVGTAGVDYNYTPPAVRGGTMQFELLTPVLPGQCVTIDYTMGFYTDFGPDLTWNNSATLDEYWSLPASSGQQYPGSGPAEFFMTNQVVPERLTKTVITPDPLVTDEVTIGELVEYSIVVPGNPVNAQLNSVVVNDTLVSELIYVDASAVDNGGNPVVLVDATAGQDVSLGIAAIPAGDQVTITLTTRVANNADANATDPIINTADYEYTGKPVAAVTGGTSGPVRIIEPLVAIAKDVSPNTPPSAGDVLTYTLTLTASGGVAADEFANAYDIRIDDSLSLGLAYVPGSATVDGAGNTILDPVITGDGVTTPQDLLWRIEDDRADIDIDEGTVVTVTYDVVVLDGVLVGQDLTNSASSEWTSIDEEIGDPVNNDERNGSGAPAYNDYFNGPVSAPTLTVPDNTTLTKTRLSDTYDGTIDVRVGDVINYELRIHLDEGSHNQLVLTDVLPQGMQFEGVVSINGATTAPYTAVAPFSHADIAAPSVVGTPLTGTTTVTWTLGDVTNIADGNAANDEFIIIYQARPINDSDYFELNPVPTLTNNATLNYDILPGPATVQQLDDETVNLRQPDLAVAKSAVPASGSVVAAGDPISFTVTITNNGDAPAYDTVIEDILSDGLRQTTPVTTQIYLSSAPGTPLPVLQPAYDLVTGTATWNLDNGVVDTYTIPVGDSLVIEYTAQADNDLGPSTNLSNAVTATVYYSLDNDEADTDEINREDYGPSNTAITTFTTPLPDALLKEITQPEATIGELFTYNITVPSTIQTTALNDVQILDNLNDVLTNFNVDLSFVSVAQLSGPVIANLQNTGDLKNLVIEDPINGIDIPAGQQVVVAITVIVNDDPANIAGDIFQNTADYTYEGLPGQPGTSGNMTITEPDLAITKTGPAIMQVGPPGSFTIDVENIGTSTAWDITIEDQLPNVAQGGMCDNDPTGTVAVQLIDGGTNPVLTENTDYTVAWAGDPACTMTLIMQTAAAALDPGEHLVITYDTVLDADTIGGINLINVASATEWFSGDTDGTGATGEIRTYPYPPGTPAPQDDHPVAVEVPTLLFSKAVNNVTSGDPANTTPGDVLEYTLTIENVSPVTVANFSLIDELDNLNALPMFEPGSLQVTSVLPGGATDNSDVNGGANATGLLQIDNLSLAAQDGVPGGPDEITVVFQAQLIPVIDSGTVVLNQAVMETFTVVIEVSDYVGIDDPTPVTVTSAPDLVVTKTSTDLTGDPDILLAGETLRYTLTVSNVGTENMINAVLTDQIPANTTYVAGTTTLNGANVADPSAGVSPLEAGMAINSSDTTTSGFVTADASGNITATITFDVTVNPTVIDGTIISNQGFVTGDGAGSGTYPQTPSDDPATATADDPTLDTVGNFAVLDATKTVSISTDGGTLNVVDTGDTLTYTIVIENIGAADATGTVLTDLLPAGTSYVAGSTTLNGAAVADIGPDSPLITGMDINALGSATGIIPIGQTATVTFDVIVTAVAGTPISNQGVVDADGLLTEPTDADGIDSNGDQPTVVVVGQDQIVTITKELNLISGISPLAGGEVEYVIRVTNSGFVPATNVVITDDLDVPTAGQMTLVPGTGLLNGLPAGVNEISATQIEANYSATYGDLAVGAVAELRFRVLLDAGLTIGESVTNTANVSWSLTPYTDSASVTFLVGGIPGAAVLNGTIWHDSNFDTVVDANETLLQDWTVELYRNSVLLATQQSDAYGVYAFSGLAPNQGTTIPYEVRFTAPNAVAGSTATLGDASSIFDDGPQQIRNIYVDSDVIQSNMNMPRQTNGVVYDSIYRTPVAGVTLTMINLTQNNSVVPDTCFDDPAHQGQVTLADGYYKFDLNFSNASCNASDEYVIQIQPPADGYEGTTSSIIPPVVPVTGVAQDVQACLSNGQDKVPATTQHCENSISGVQPASDIAPGTVGTEYYLKFVFTDADFTREIYNNHIPVDPELEEVLGISKVAGKQNVVRSELVPYTIKVNNGLPVPLYNLNIIDNFPAGFKYVEGSSRINGEETITTNPGTASATVVPAEPQILGNVMTWPNFSLAANEDIEIKMLLVVGSGVGEGEYVNTAQIFNANNNSAFSGLASATVQVIPDPTFDCSDVIGKVFDDKNLNYYQDEGEPGLAGVEVATARGLRVTTDKYGRFHITCAVVPNETRGSNFIMKVDERSLPSGYRITTENPRVQRATRGKMLKFNFGATIHRVVRLDLANGVFEKDGTALRPQWKSRIDMLIGELQKDPSILRLTYLGENESESLVDDRLDAIEDIIEERWEYIDCCYKLTIEKEVFWRKGKPGGRQEFE